FDFSQFSPNTSPTGFVSTVTGKGKPGDWKIIEEEIPAALAPLSPNAPKTGKRPALAQLSQDSIDEHFPLLIFDNERFGDFTLATRFKCVSGSVEQMAGIAFRIQDEKNYYVVRASALGNSFRFYKFVNGERSAPIGPQVEIPLGVWQEMSIECKGNQIRCLLNGKELIPTLSDNSFSAGKIGFWTKSDSVSYFADTKVSYTPRVPLVQTIIRDMMERYPRVIGLKIFSPNSAKEVRVIASNDEKQNGELGKKVEQDVIATGTPYYAKSKETVSVILPLRDRNGETVAALRVILKPFPGQTENNALARALPIAKAIEARIVSSKDLIQ
ncbi:MAG: family 16 glycoside hydrolase, partial [Verrucomicrobiota bacterium]